jgi:hypothetical protein
MVPVIAGGELFSMGVVRARQFYIVNKGPVREKPRNLVDLAVLESHAGHVVLRGPPPGATPYVRHQETDGWSPSLAANWWVHLWHPHPGWLPVGHGQPTPSPRTRPCYPSLTPPTGESAPNTALSPAPFETQVGPPTGRSPFAPQAPTASVNWSVHHSMYIDMYPGHSAFAVREPFAWPSRQLASESRAQTRTQRPVIRLPPSKRPALPGQLMGRCKTNKSSQGRADAQRLVATRLLDRLHDPLGHFSRLQRIYPRAR